MVSLRKDEVTNFINTWNEAGSLKELTGKYNITKQEASNLATTLRSKGYKLKKYKRGKAELNWKELRELADSYNKGEK